MNTSTHEQIERYLQGQISENERLAFEQQLAEDAELRETTALYATWEKALGNSALNQFRQTVTAAMRARRPAGPLIMLRRYLFPSLALILTLSIAGWFLCRKPDPAEQIFARHFKPEFVGSNMRGAGQNTDDLHQKAMDFYQKGDYAAAISIFEKMLNDNGAQHNSAVYLELAQLYLLNKQPDAARRALDQVLQGRTDEKNWYTALSFVQEHRFAQAVPYLEKLAQNDGPFQKEAAAVLEEIR